MYKYVKRGIDLVMAVLLLIIFLIPMLIIAVLIKLDSKGPVLFKQKRTGLKGKVFNLYNQNLMRVESLISVFRMSGFNIDILSKEEFNNLLHSIATTDKYSALDSIVNDFSVDADNQLSLNYNFSVNIKSEFTINYLHMLGFDWPVITDEYIYKIIDYMKKVGFIK